MSTTISTPAAADAAPAESLWTTRPPLTGLKRRSVRGAAITGTAQFLKFVIRFGGTAILARLLTPADFGLVAMTAVITGFLGMFTDAGLSSATIQREQITHRQISALFWINTAMGLLLALLVVALAPAVAWFYDEPRLTLICAALGISFVFGGVTVQHHSLLRREMRFALLAKIEILTMTIATLTAVALAGAGFGYWSLVGMSIATAVVPAICVWLSLDWRPSRPQGLSSSLPLLRFGGDVLTFNVVNYFARQADKLLIGWYWGPAALGLYDKAYALLLLPVKQINGPLGAVAMPALARTQSDPARFARFFLSSLQLVASVSVPLVVVAALFADEIVRLWLGPDWAECAHLFRLLAVAAALGAINNPLGWFLVSLGRTRRFRQLGVRNSAAIVLGFAFGIPFGPEGVALAYSIITAIIFLPSWWFVLRGTPVSLRQLGATLLPPMAAVIPALAAALAVRALELAPAQPWVSPVLAAAAFGSTYAVVLLVGFQRWAFFRGIMADLRP